MNKMPVDIKKACAIGLRFDNMIIPDFIVERSLHGLHPLNSREQRFSGVLETPRGKRKAMLKLSGGHTTMSPRWRFRKKTGAWHGEWLMRSVCILLYLLASFSAAFAGAASDCGQSKNHEARIAGCTLIAEGKAEGNKQNALTHRADAYYQKREYDSALSDLDEVLRQEPKHLSALLLRGAVYLEKQDYDNAIADCTEAMRLSPGNALLLQVRCTAYLAKSDYDGAIADCSEAIRLKPNRVIALMLRGTAYGGKGWTMRAASDFYHAAKKCVKEGCSAD
jgi:tetratricopeptide (TPR) repeat protein